MTEGLTLRSMTGGWDQKRHIVTAFFLSVSRSAPSTRRSSPLHTVFSQCNTVHQQTQRRSERPLSSPTTSQTHISGLDTGQMYVPRFSVLTRDAFGSDVFIIVFSLYIQSARWSTTTLSCNSPYRFLLPPKAHLHSKTTHVQICVPAETVKHLALSSCIAVLVVIPRMNLHWGIWRSC